MGNTPPASQSNFYTKSGYCKTGWEWMDGASSYRTHTNAYVGSLGRNKKISDLSESYKISLCDGQKAPFDKTPMYPSYRAGKGWFCTAKPGSCYEYMFGPNKWQSGWGYTTHLDGSWRT